MAKDWIQPVAKKMKKGKLHKELNVPEGKKIPAKKMDKALHSKNPTVKKEAVLAKNMQKKK